jgi:TonB family protein
MNPHDRWFDGLARNLIRHAARRAPPALTERLGEEWLSDLTGRSGAFSQLRFALGCCWATTVIAREFGAPVRAAAAASGSKTAVVDHADPGWSLSRRTTVILLIVGLHVLVICVLATAIEAHKVPKATPPPPRIEVRVLPRPEPPIPPVPSDPKLTQIRPEVPTPPWKLQAPSDPVPVGEPVTGGQPTPAGTSTPKPVNRVLGGPGAGFPNADDFYPQASIRLREMGIATVSVCVDGAGRLTGTPSIGQSSGSARLDEAALRLARAGSGHYRATTEDGRPVSACYPFNVRFRLRD